jgi:hypothetical protein
MLGYMAIGLAVLVSNVPASFAQNSRGLEHCQSAATGIEAEERQTPQRAGSNTGVFVEVPIGKVCVGPESVGEPVFVRRTTVGQGMTIVEVSTTPFTAVLGSNEAPPGVRPDQPASW